MPARTVIPVAQLCGFTIRPAAEEDLPGSMGLIWDLVVYEKLTHEVVATEESLPGRCLGIGRRPRLCWRLLTRSLRDSPCTSTRSQRSWRGGGCTCTTCTCRLRRPEGRRVGHAAPTEIFE